LINNKQKFLIEYKHPENLGIIVSKKEFIVFNIHSLIRQQTF